jgi:mono/diheme cytochrome c family protein
MSNVAKRSLLGAAFLVAAASSAKDDAAAGREARPFVSYGCYQCHGYSGQGASSGPRLSADMSYEGFQQIVRFPYGVMPAYPRELLKDEDLRAIYAFVQSQPPAPHVKDLPLLYDTSKAKGSHR